MLAAKSFQVTAVPASLVCAGRDVSRTSAALAGSYFHHQGAWGPPEALCDACSSVLRSS